MIAPDHNRRLQLAALAAAATLAGLGAAAWVLSPLIALSAAAAGVVVRLLYRGLRRQATRLGEALDIATRHVHGDVSEKLAALRVIKSLGRENETEQRNVEEFQALRRTQRVWQHSVGLGQGALEGGGALVLAALVWIALTHWHTPAITILPMVALFARALPLLGALQLHWQNWARSRSARPSGWRGGGPALDPIDRARPRIAAFSTRRAAHAGRYFPGDRCARDGNDRRRLGGGQKHPGGCSRWSAVTRCRAGLGR